MTLWRWFHAEYHTHEGWVPMIDISVFHKDEPRETVQVREDDVVAYDTKRAARVRNRDLARRYAKRHGWDFLPADNELGLGVEGR